MRAFLSLLVLTITSSASSAAIRPSFYADGCAWNATHIVVATEGEKIDGILTVIESWKGDLKKADTITVPELAAFADRKEREVKKGLFADDKPDPTHVSGSRMVLFLIEGPKDEKDKRTWKPAGSIWKNRMEVSVAWIEKNKVHAIEQQINPGPSELIYLGKNECEFACRVQEIVTMQARFYKAMSAANPDQIAESVEGLLRSDSSNLGREAIKTLGNADKNGLVVLRKLLKQDAFEKFHEDVIEAMPNAGGASVGAELTVMLKEDLAFWKKASPGLKKGWWNGNGIEWEKVEHHRNHYSRSLAIIRGLQGIKFPECRGDIQAFRDFWVSQPQLGEIDQMTDACDKILVNVPVPKK